MKFWLVRTTKRTTRGEAGGSSSSSECAGWEDCDGGVLCQLDEEKTWEEDRQQGRSTNFLLLLSYILSE